MQNPNGKRLSVGIMMPDRRAGGVFQSALTLIAHFEQCGFEVCLFESASNPTSELTGHNVRVCRFPIQLNAGVLRKVFVYLTLASGKTNRDGERLEALVREASVDVLVFATPLACPPPRGIPYVVIIPDLMHRYYPCLPEYRWPKHWARDIVYGRY